LNRRPAIGCMAGLLSSDDVAVRSVSPSTVRESPPPQRRFFVCLARGGTLAVGFVQELLHEWC
jgi:hypothetical protein